MTIILNAKTQSHEDTKILDLGVVAPLCLGVQNIIK